MGLFSVLAYPTNMADIRQQLKQLMHDPEGLAIPNAAFGVISLSSPVLISLYIWLSQIFLVCDKCQELEEQGINSTGWGRGRAAEQSIEHLVVRIAKSKPYRL